MRTVLPVPGVADKSPTATSTQPLQPQEASVTKHTTLLDQLAPASGGPPALGALIGVTGAGGPHLSAPSPSLSAAVLLGDRNSAKSGLA